MDSGCLFPHLQQVQEIKNVKLLSSCILCSFILEGLDSS